jgi:hypothetical protein
VYVGGVAAGAPPERAAALLPALEFVPDAMVLEGEWQQERELARQMETWRVELGQKLSSEVFLREARHALYLRRAIARDGVRHVHAPGPAELLTGWILRRLCGVTLSVTLEKKETGLGDTLLGRMLRDCVGVRCGFDEAVCEKWLNGQPSRPVVVPFKPGRAVEAPWGEQMQRWASAAGQP